MSGVDGVSRKDDPYAWAADKPRDCDRASPKAARAPWDVADAPIREAVQQYAAEMFSNPALTGKKDVVARTSADAPTKPACALFSSPPTPPLPPGIPPTAPDAYRGIQLQCLAENLLPLPSGGRPLVCGNYKLFPALARQPDGTQAVAYWVAYNTQTKRNEFVVGPDDLARFQSASGLFEIAAANAYMHGEPSKWELESMKAVDAAMRKGPLAALEHLGKAWVAAVKDPNWWMQNAAAAGGLAVAEEGAAARATSPPASEMGRSTPIVPGGGLAAHEGGAVRAHTIAKHVSKLDAQLVERANTPVTRPDGTTGKPPLRVSSFYDRATAETAAAKTIAANEAEIKAWIDAGGKGKLEIIDPSPAAPVGRSVERWGSQPSDVRGTKLVLVGDKQMPCGFRILTGFPEP